MTGGEAKIRLWRKKAAAFLCELFPLHWRMTAVEALKIAQSTEGPAIQQAMFKVDFDAVTGHITIDPTTGDANKTMAYIKQATDGAFTFIKTQSVAK